MNKPVSTSSIVRQLFIWVVIGAIIFITAIALMSDSGKVITLLKSIAPNWIIAIIASVMFNYLLRFAKWTYFLHLLGISLPIKQNLWIFFSAFTMVLSPGKLGELVKSFLIRSRFGIAASKTAPIVLAERITDLIGLLILCTFGFSQFAFGGKTLLIVGIILVSCIFLMTQEKFWKQIGKLLGKFPKLDKFKQSINAIADSTQNLLSLKSIVFTAPLSALSWSGEGFALYLIFKAMGLDIPNLIAISLFAHAFSSIIGALSFIPGGLLATEGAMAIFFVYVDIPKDIAVSATFAIRAVTLWFAVILGTVVFIIGHRQDDLKMFSEPVKKEDVEIVNQ